jgi:hypothetical protein
MLIQLPQMPWPSTPPFLKLSEPSLKSLKVFITPIGGLPINIYNDIHDAHLLVFRTDVDNCKSHKTTPTSGGPQWQLDNVPCGIHIGIIKHSPRKVTSR